MAAKNERKLEVLKFVDQEGEVTPDQVADIFGMEIHNARMQLQRYWQAGLLYRRMINRKRKQRAYRISEKGLDRISWLEENNQTFSARMRRIVKRMGKRMIT